MQPTRAAQDAYSAEIEAMSAGTVWTAGGCRSWYLDEHGRNVNIWPATTFGFRRRTRSFDPAAHLLHRRRSPATNWSYDPAVNAAPRAPAKWET